MLRSLYREAEGLVEYQQRDVALQIALALQRGGADAGHVALGACHATRALWIENVVATSLSRSRNRRKLWWACRIREARCLVERLEQGAPKYAAEWPLEGIALSLVRHGFARYLIVPCGEITQHAARRGASAIDTGHAFGVRVEQKAFQLRTFFPRR